MELVEMNNEPRFRPGTLCRERLDASRSGPAMRAATERKHDPTQSQKCRGLRNTHRIVGMRDTGE